MSRGQPQRQAVDRGPCSGQAGAPGEAPRFPKPLTYTHQVPAISRISLCIYQENSMKNKTKKSLEFEHLRCHNVVIKVPIWTSFTHEVKIQDRVHKWSSYGLLKARGVQFQLCKTWQKKSQAVNTRSLKPADRWKRRLQQGVGTDPRRLGRGLSSTARPPGRPHSPARPSQCQRRSGLDEDYRRAATLSLMKLELKSHSVKCLRVLVFITSKKLTCRSELFPCRKWEAMC